MADPKGGPDLKRLLKLSGGILFMIWAIVLLIQRFPRMGYVDIIPDAPKRPPVVALPAPSKQPPKPVAVAKGPAAAATLLMPESPAGGPMLDLEEACEMEIGILCCCRLPIKEVQSCLASYEEGLRKNCLKALDQRRGAR